MDVGLLPGKVSISTTERRDAVKPPEEVQAAARNRTERQAPVVGGLGDRGGRPVDEQESVAERQREVLRFRTVFRDEEGGLTRQARQAVAAYQSNSGASDPAALLVGIDAYA